MYAKQSNSLLLINAFAASQLQNVVQVYDTNGNPKANKIFLPTHQPVLQHQVER